MLSNLSFSPIAGISASKDTRGTAGVCSRSSRRAGTPPGAPLPAPQAQAHTTRPGRHQRLDGRRRFVQPGPEAGQPLSPPPAGRRSRRGHGGAEGEPPAGRPPAGECRACAERRPPRVCSVPGRRSPTRPAGPVRLRSGSPERLRRRAGVGGGGAGPSRGLVMLCSCRAPGCAGKAVSVDGA